MTEPTDRRIDAELTPEPADSAREWQAPTLTALGDAVPLTLGVTGAIPDGPGSVLS
jgi:hypothetical protein